MPLKIVGSGFGRTGTMSMKEALGILDLGPCHHMTEIMEHPEQLARWKSIFAGEQVDYEDVYAGYISQVDWPGASVWHEASIAFPDAKIIHTERPAEDWWNSFNGTIGKFFSDFHKFASVVPPHFSDIFQTMANGFLKDTFTDYTERDVAIAAFNANNQKVREMIPADRLFVFNVAEGWEPLCDFLELGVPDVPFPHRNPRKDFWEMFGGEPE